MSNFSVVQYASVLGTPTSANALFSNPVTVGNIIVAVIGAYLWEDYPTGVTDSLGNSYALYSQSGGDAINNAACTFMYAALNVQAGTTTVSFNGWTLGNFYGIHDNSPTMIVAEIRPPANYQVWGQGLTVASLLYLQMQQNNSYDVGDSSYVFRAIANNGPIGGLGASDTGQSTLTILPTNAPYASSAMVGLALVDEFDDVFIVAANGNVGGASSSPYFTVTGGTLVAEISNPGVGFVGNYPYDLGLAVGDFPYSVAPTPLSLACGLTPNGSVGVSYSDQLVASGGSGTYTSYAITSGSLPPGLSLNTSTGLISGTPTTAGTYPFTAQVTDSSSNTATVDCSITIGGGPVVGNCSITIYPFTCLPPRLTCCDQDLYFEYTDTMGNAMCLRYEIPQKRWFLHSYGDGIVTHYLSEYPVDSPNVMDILMPSRTQPLIYLAGGDTDNNVPISTILQTPSPDSGDQRAQKLYVDVMNDVGGLGTMQVSPNFNNANVAGPVVVVPCPGLGARSQQLVNISSLANLALYRNISMEYRWTGGPDGPKLFAMEPSGFLQPYLSTFFVIQFSPFSFPGWKSWRRMFPALISNANVLMTIATQDGRTYGPLTIPSTGGQYRVLPQMLPQNIKDLAFSVQLDGQGSPFALFIGDFTAELKEWNESTYVKLAFLKT
jgi:hypothetical protein